MSKPVTANFCSVEQQDQRQSHVAQADDANLRLALLDFARPLFHHQHPGNETDFSASEGRSSRCGAEKSVRVKCRLLLNPRTNYYPTHYFDSFQQGARQAYENIGGDARLQ